MKKLFLYIIILFVLGLSCTNSSKKQNAIIQKQDILSYVVNPIKQNLIFHWKNKHGIRIQNFENLKNQIENKAKKLIFATNGGMFKKDFSPQGLYIENGKILNNIDTLTNAFGNFYLQPNGIFYLTNDNKAVICKTVEFKNRNIKYATQSGPMLLVDGKINSKLTKGSKNLNIRNGVGVLPNGNLLFAMSKRKINFYDFANYFKERDCKNALYLDGFVSKTY
jgi:uncharacterized protein YigE (DUF2233 family)